MSAETDLPYSFCKRFGIVASTAVSDGKLSLITRQGTSINAINEAQRLLGLVDSISVENDQEFNRSLSQHFEKIEKPRSTKWKKLVGNSICMTSRGNWPNQKIYLKAMPMRRLFD